LSVGKICDAKHNITFYSRHSEIITNGSKRVIGRGMHTLGNVYVLDEIEGERCYLSQSDNSWLPHKRLAHLNFDNLVKISRTEAIRGLPKLSKPTDKLCSACQHGKQARAN